MVDCDITEELVRRAQDGDTDARQQLLSRHRDRLRRMIGVFLDSRLSARVDASDVVQDTLVCAAARLQGYLECPPIAFYPWLRQIGRDQLIKVHRKHVKAQRRSVRREQPMGSSINDVSAMQIVERLIGSETSPSQQVSSKENKERVKAALFELSADDRELLLMRFVEQLSICEISEVTAITEEAAKSRVRRGLQKLNRHLGIN